MSKLPEIFVAPRKGVLVRKPNGVLLKKEGETVPENSFWLRRLRGKDVVKATPKKIKKGKAK
jgi:hypothetical protein